MAADLRRSLYVEVFGLREEVEPAIDVHHHASWEWPLQVLCSTTGCRRVMHFIAPGTHCARSQKKMRPVVS